MSHINHYKEKGLFDFYTFDFEEDAKQFKEENKEYNNIYYSWSWKAWVSSKTRNSA